MIKTLVLKKDSKYLVHDGHRWRVLRSVEDPQDGTMLELGRFVGRVGKERTWRTLWARPADCQSWERPGVVRIKSSESFKGRRTILEFDKRSQVVTLRLERSRSGLTSHVTGGRCTEKGNFVIPGICNVAKDMMICWVAAEKHAGRFYGSMAQALPAFQLYLIKQGWNEQQAAKLAHKADA